MTGRNVPSLAEAAEIALSYRWEQWASICGGIDETRERHRADLRAALAAHEQAEAERREAVAELIRVVKVSPHYCYYECPGSRANAVEAPKVCSCGAKTDAKRIAAALARCREVGS